MTVVLFMLKDNDVDDDIKSLYSILKSVFDMQMHLQSPPESSSAESATVKVGKSRCSRTAGLMLCNGKSLRRSRLDDALEVIWEQRQPPQQPPGYRIFRHLRHLPQADHLQREKHPPNENGGQKRPFLRHPWLKKASTYHYLYASQ